MSKKLFKDTGIRSIALLGGANVERQIDRFRDLRPHVVIATPGRLAQLTLGLKKIHLGNVRALVLDEIDNMLEDTYAEDLYSLVQTIPVIKRNLGPAIWAVNTTTTASTSDKNLSTVTTTDRHLSYICMASATANNVKVKKFMDQITMNTSHVWQHVTINNGSVLPESITHGVISVERSKEYEQLKRLLHAKPEVRSALIFVNSPYKVKVLTEQLGNSSFVVAPLHGDSSKEDRAVSCV